MADDEFNLEEASEENESSSAQDSSFSDSEDSIVVCGRRKTAGKNPRNKEWGGDISSLVPQPASNERLSSEDEEEVSERTQRRTRYSNLNQRGAK